MLASTQHCPNFCDRRHTAKHRPPWAAGNPSPPTAFPAYPVLIFTSSPESEERPRLLRQQQTGALIRSPDSSARRDRTHVQPNPRR